MVTDAAENKNEKYIGRVPIDDPRYFDNTPPVVGGIPDQTVVEGGSFATINLDDYVSDVEDFLGGVFHNEICPQTHKDRGVKSGQKRIDDKNKKEDPFQAAYRTALFPFRLYRISSLK